MKRLFKPIDLETDYILNYQKSYFSVVVPEDGKNLIYNCEIYDLNGYAGSIPLAINPNANYGTNSIDANMGVNDLILYNLNEPLNGTEYTFSCYVKGQGKFKIYINDSLNNQVGGVSVVETYNFINRITHTFSNITTNNPKIVILAEESGSFNFSGFQFENKPYATTFISGNQKGAIQGQTPNPYYWVGVPHRSASVRTKEVRTGGKIVNFKDLDFDVISFEGLGLPDFDHVSTQTAQRYGSIYNCSAIEEREITINGQITSCAARDFFCKKGNFSQYLSPILLQKSQPIKFIFQLFDCLTPLTQCYEFYALYNGGFNDSIETIYGQKVSLQLVLKDPFIYSCTTNSTDICLFSTISNTNIIGKDENGVFNDLNGGTLLEEQIRKMTIGSDNLLYTIGDKPGQGVVISRWNGSTWQIVGQSIDLGGNGYAIEVGINNTIYVGGQFNGIDAANNGYGGNFPPTMNLARYDIFLNTWQWIGNINGEVRAIEQLINGKIVIGGKFSSVTDVNGFTSLCKNVVFYDPSTNTFSAMNGINTGIGTGSDTIFAIKQTPDKKIWYGGNFTTTVGLLTVNNVVYSTETSPSANQLQYVESLERRNFRTTFISVGADAVYDLEFDNNGILYACGYFDASTAVNNLEAVLPVTNHATNVPFSVAKLNGITWSAIGMLATLSPANPSLIGSAFVVDIDKDTNGNIYFAGRFNYAGSAQFSSTPVSANNINPMNNLSNYTPNTFGLTCYNGSKFINNIVFNGTSSNPFIGTIKSGGYYPFSSFTSTYSSLPVYTQTNPNSLPSNQQSFYIAGLQGNYNVSCAKTITKECSEISYPTFVITGRGNLLSINNLTTGAVLNFEKELLDGEVLIVDLTSPIPYIFSNLFGLQNNLIRGGSFVSNFVLYNGNNSISVAFEPTTITAETNVRIYWKNSFTSIENALCCNE